MSILTTFPVYSSIPSNTYYVPSEFLVNPTNFMVMTVIMVEITTDDYNKLPEDKDMQEKYFRVHFSWDNYFIIHENQIAHALPAGKDNAGFENIILFLTLKSTIYLNNNENNNFLPIELNQLKYTLRGLTSAKVSSIGGDLKELQAIVNMNLNDTATYGSTRVSYSGDNFLEMCTAAHK